MQPVYTEPCKFCYRLQYCLPFKNFICTVPRDSVNERRTRAIFFRLKICLHPCKWVSFFVKQTSSVDKIVPFFYTVEPSVGDHPKCRLSGRLQVSNLWGPLRRRVPGTSALWKIIYCMQCLSYDRCNDMLSLKVFVYSK